MTANLPVWETIQFKAIKRNGDNVAWEDIENRSYTVPADGGAISLSWSVSGETTLVPVQFTVNEATTTWGENIYISGNVPEIGNWDVDLAAGPALCPDYPTWTIFIDVPSGETVEWKAIKKGSNTSVEWQSGDNNSFVVPANGVGATMTNWN